MSWQKPVGAVLIVIGFAAFFLMVYGLVLWGPIAIVFILVWMGCVSVGAILLTHKEKPEIVPEEVGEIGSVPQSGIPEREFRGETVSFHGYCPRCGSPVDEGADSCPVCGWRRP